MLKTVRNGHSQKTELWSLYKTHGGSFFPNEWCSSIVIVMSFKVARFDVMVSNRQRRAISRAYRQGATAIGEASRILEEYLCDLFKYKHALLTTNASLGLWLAFETSSHRRFSVPPLSTCNAVTSSIRNAGKTYSYRTKLAENALETRSLEQKPFSTVKVPLFGRLEQVSGELGSEVIEDSSQAFLTRMSIRSAAEVMVLSMYPTKFPGGVDGGAVLTNDTNRYEQMNDLVGRSSTSTDARRNWTLSNLNAVAIVAGLETINGTIERLHSHFQGLSDSASEANLDFLPKNPGEVPTRFILRPGSPVEANRLFSEFRSQGIEASYELVNFQSKEAQNGSLENAHVEQSWLSVPMYFGMATRKHQLVRRAIEKSVGRISKI